MASRKRRRFTPEEKAAILRRHLSDKILVADLCDEYKIQPSLFYQWLRQLLDHADRALEPSRHAGQRERKLASQVEVLEQRLQHKDGIIARISEEFVQVKKELGEL